MAGRDSEIGNQTLDKTQAEEPIQDPKIADTGYGYGGPNPGYNGPGAVGYTFDKDFH
jgi:hypothetical protein